MTGSTDAQGVRRTVAAIVREVESTLGACGIENARSEAASVVAACVGEPRWWSSLHRDDLVSDPIRESIARATKRLCERMPFAYAVGRADFRSITLCVDERVLIPRPETELLVEIVLRECSSRAGGLAADVGTGSGAIALSLAVEGKFARIIATDVSADALAVAQQNARALQKSANTGVEFRQGNALVPLEGERLDVLVSNPPYIAFSEVSALPSLVRNWEPPSALACPEDGLAITRAIVEGAGRVLATGGLLALEVDSRRGNEVVAMVTDATGFEAITLHRDLTGRDRFVTARWMR